jgi:pimeloyl-ACP methyl ester carboxylesterase
VAAQVAPARTARDPPALGVPRRRAVGDLEHDVDEGAVAALGQRARRVAGTRPPDAAIRKGLGAGLPDDVVQGLVEDYAAESPALFLERTGTPVLPPVRRYLMTSRDREVPTAVQRSSAGTLRAQHVTEVATGHLPQLEAPGAVLQELRLLLGEVTG